MNDIESQVNKIKLDEECMICINIMKEEDSYRLICGHKFHKECLKEWFKSTDTKYSINKKICPYCRTESKNLKNLYKDDIELNEKEIYDTVNIYYLGYKSIKLTNEIMGLYNRCCAFTKNGTRCKSSGKKSEDEVKTEGNWYYCKRHIEYSKYK